MVSDEIGKTLDDLGQRFGMAVDWMQGNVFPYMTELLFRFVNYKLYMASIAVGISVLFILTSSIYLYKSNKKAKIFEWNGYYSGCFVNGNVRAIIAIILMAISVFIILPIFLVNVNTIVKCLTIPELVIFKYIESLK